MRLYPQRTRQPRPHRPARQRNPQQLPPYLQPPRPPQQHDVRFNSPRLEVTPNPDLLEEWPPSPIQPSIPSRLARAVGVARLIKLLKGRSTPTSNG